MVSSSAGHTYKSTIQWHADIPIDYHHIIFLCKTVCSYCYYLFWCTMKNIFQVYHSQKLLFVLPRIGYHTAWKIKLYINFQLKQACKIVFWTLAHSQVVFLRKREESWRTTLRWYTRNKLLSNLTQGLAPKEIDSNKADPIWGGWDLDYCLCNKI